MKIPTPWSAIRGLDHEVHYLFMKAGIDKIPEKTRAAWSYGLSIGGAAFISAGVMGPLSKLTGSTALATLHAFPNIGSVVPNTFHSKRVMDGRVSTATNDTLDYSTQKIKAWNQKIRPLYLLLGTYLGCRIGFDVIDSTFTDTVLDFMGIFHKTLISGGSAAVATAFYINDVDPKVLDKGSKLQNAYDSVTGKMEPVPVNNYQTLEATL